MNARPAQVKHNARKEDQEQDRPGGAEQGFQ